MTIDSTTKVYLNGVEQVKIIKNGSVIWEKQQDNTDYFYIQNTYAGQNTVTLTTTQSGTPTSGSYTTSVQYSKDKSTWTTLTLTAGGSNTISLNQGEKVYFRNDNGKFNYKDNTDNRLTTITATEAHVTGGKLTTLLDYTNDNVTMSIGCFFKLFDHDTYLTGASNLTMPNRTSSYCYGNMFAFCTDFTNLPTLPATTLAEGCYQGMFALTSVVNVPSDYLPATTLADSCYSYMFQMCPNLTTLPSMPATTIPTECYLSMFEGCTSLTTIPSNYLPATTLGVKAYRKMFKNCTGLTNSVPNLPATTLTEDCYGFMFDKCSNLTTAPTIAATTVALSSCQYMFRNCTSLTTAPVLHASVLAEKCYYYMFDGCSSLNSITSYADNVTATQALYRWVRSVAATGTLYNFGSATYPSGTSGIPSGWTQHKIKMTDVVLTPATGTEYSVTANVEWSPSLTWTSGEINISNNDQGAGNKNAYLTFTPSEVVNGVLTTANNIDIWFSSPDTWFTLTVYNGNTVVDTQYVPYTISYIQ